MDIVAAGAKITLKVASKVALEVSPKVASKIAKFIGKKLPLISFGIGIGLGVIRFIRGEKIKGCIEILSGFAALFPGIGTAISIVLDVGLLLHDDLPQNDNNVLPQNDNGDPPQNNNGDPPQNDNGNLPQNDNEDPPLNLNEANEVALDILNPPEHLTVPESSIDSTRVEANRGYIDDSTVLEEVELLSQPQITNMQSLQFKQNSQEEMIVDQIGSPESSLHPGKLSYCLSEDHNILDASLYHVNFLSHIVTEKITDQITVSVCQASKCYILHAKSNQKDMTDHLAIVFENDFTIKCKDETYKKRHLVLHALQADNHADGATNLKAVIKIEFFCSREEIKQHLFRGDSWEYYFSHLPQMCYVGLNSFSTLLSEIKGKDFILDAPLRWNVDEAKKENFINCKKFVIMICDSFNINIDKEIKTSYLEMACFKTKERIEQIEANGWNLASIWQFA